jgi:hypothetical protein
VIARIEITSRFNARFTDNCGGSGNLIFDMDASILRQRFCQSFIQRLSASFNRRWFLFPEHF